MGVSFRDGKDKRCKENIINFFAVVFAECVLNCRIYVA